MRLVSFKRFELDLPTLMTDLRNSGKATGNLSVDFSFENEGSLFRSGTNSIEQVGEPIVVELINPDLMTYTGILKLIDKDTNKYLIGFTAINKTVFINFSFEVVMDKNTNFYSVTSEVKASLVIEPIERIKMPVMKFIVLASFLRAYKNNVETPVLIDNDMFLVDAISISGETKTFQVPYAYLKRMCLITETGNYSFTVNIDRGIRLLKYIARTNELTTTTMLGEVSDI